MKKLIILLLALMLVLSGCGVADEARENLATEVPVEVPTEEPTEVPTEVPTEEPTPAPTPPPPAAALTQPRA
ncbi:MAG: hypothetical protein Q4C01_05370, partial [Clostridia bacterium]|nr:hypothetical protein [Clostridia bacterium]